MVGRGVLLECLDDARVTTVLAVGRAPCGVTHPKLEELQHADFLNWDAVAARFAGADACFYCLGVTSAGTSEADYTRITYDFAVAAASEVATASPSCVLCFVSGAGADSSERSRVMCARVKGRTENAMLRLPFRHVHVFRPSVIQPLRGVRSRTKLYAVFYAMTGPLLSLLLRIAPAWVTTTVRLGRAMIEVALSGHQSRILESRNINAVIV
jgi:uncharacterized protein YbjT (DUF2867 family)